MADFYLYFVLNIKSPGRSAVAAIKLEGGSLPDLEIGAGLGAQQARRAAAGLPLFCESAHCMRREGGRYPIYWILDVPNRHYTGRQK